MEKIQKQSRYEIRFMTEKGNVIVGRYFDSRDGIKKDLPIDEYPYTRKYKVDLVWKCCKICLFEDKPNID